MKHFWRVLRIAAACGALWAGITVSFALGSNRSTTAMLALLAVLAIATLGDWVLAFASSSAASLAFSYYFIDAIGSFEITTSQGAITFAAMALTALTGSRLSIRARKRADEAIRRRTEMEQLHELGQVLLAAVTVRDAAENAVRKVVDLFGVEGAVLRIDGQPEIHQAGRTGAVGEKSVMALDGGNGLDYLELHGPQASEEVRHAIASMIYLVIERARTAEAKTRIEAEQRGEELRNTVLNALAHNFRTPLTSIKAAASALRESRSLSSPADRDLATVIDEESDRLDQQIQESLDLARIESRSLNPRSELCDISAIVQRVTSRLSRYLERRDFLVDIPDDLQQVLGDPFLFDQMLIQVVDNAWKYSQPGARIEIAAECANGEIILTVRNEASDILPGEQVLIFDKFYRGTKNRTSVEGTGLGLAISRNIAEAFGGRVWLDMEAGGPAFRFALPAAAKNKRESFDTEPNYIAH